MAKTPSHNLPQPSIPWGNSVEQRLAELGASASRRQQGEGNTNKSQSATIRVLQEQVAGLAALVNDLTQQVQDAINSNSYTSAQIDTKIANPPGAVTIGGLLTANAGIVSVDVRNTLVGADRASVWVDGTGRIGIAP